jgi:hypothetical protein
MKYLHIDFQAIRISLYLNLVTSGVNKDYPYDSMVLDSIIKTKTWIIQNFLFSKSVIYLLKAILEIWALGNDLLLGSQISL